MCFLIGKRCVAQLGRALRSGRRGRRFKSCRIDYTGISVRVIENPWQGRRSVLSFESRAVFSVLKIFAPELKRIRICFEKHIYEFLSDKGNVTCRKKHLSTHSNRPCPFWRGISSLEWDMEAKDKEEREFFELIGIFLLQRKQKEAIEKNLF